MNPGGITNENAHDIMSANAHRRFPMRNVQITRIERGTLDSHGVKKEVGYADYSRQMVLSNTPGIRATYYLDQNRDVVYTALSILGCGNDILMQGHGIAEEGITFTLHPVPEEAVVYAEVVPEPTPIEEPVAPTYSFLNFNLIEMLKVITDSDSGVKFACSVTPDGRTEMNFHILPGRDGQQAQLPPHLSPSDAIKASQQ